MTVSDSAGNPATVDITFPAVDKGDQTLSGFQYSAASVEYGADRPAVTPPTGERTTLSYSASPDSVCTVDAATGVLTLVGAGDCVITVTAAGTADYNEASDTFTVAVQPAGTLALNLNAIATDDTINIAEKASGFAISGDTGTETGVTVIVGIGGTTLTATSADEAGTAAWSVSVPADAAYITGTSVAVAVNASKTGYSPPGAEQRALTVDLVAPAPPAYTAPGSLTVGVPIAAMNPSGGVDVAAHDATGLPPGLDIDTASGAISGTPGTANASTALATVTVMDTAGNPATVDITFPAVDKGDQALSGFQYSAASVEYGAAAPTVTEPTGEQTTLSYSASPDTVCTAAAATGVLTLVGAGDCVVTVTAASTANYKQASDTFTVTVQPAATLVLNVSAIAGDGTVNIAEKASGFAISGDTGSVGEVSVTVTVGETNLTATSSTANPATWSVTVPADAAYITGTSVAVAVNASKTGYSPPGAEQRTLTVDLVAPAPPGYTAPGSLTVGVPIAAMNPSGGAGIDEYAAPGLPSGLSIHATTGAIGGTPDTAEAGAAEVTVTVSDSAGNADTVDITFPAVAKGDQTLSGFQYSAASVEYGAAAPTVTEPTGERTTLSYSATPATVCTAAAATGVLTLVGAGDCVVTVTAAGSDDYNEASDTFTVTVQAIDQLALNVNAIATDNTINIAEKASGFAISGDTGSVGGVDVTVGIGAATLTATSADEAGTAAWSVSVPRNASYIAGTSVAVAVNASKTGYSPPGAEQRTLTVDLVAPAPPGYTAPGSLTVGVPIAAMNPSGGAGIDEYDAPGLPSGLSIHATTGAISGTPDTAEAGAAEVTVTVSDSAGNPATVDITFPAVAKGDQTLSGFQYSAASVEYGAAAPTVTEPTGERTTLSYSATPATVCTVAAATGALTLVGAGDCVVTVTAAGSDDYNEASDTFTVAVQPAGTLALNLDAIATDDTINIAEKASGFAISGDTGSVGEVSVTVTVGETNLTATSSTANPATWSVTVPADAAYITGTSVAVAVNASKTGYSPPGAEQRTLTVDLVAPAPPGYTAPGSLTVGVPIAAMNPSGGAGIDEYAAPGLPSGLSIHATTGAISGTPDTAEAGAAEVTVTVSDSAGNPATVDITFPAVAKGDQTLSGFQYGAASVRYGDAAPAVTPPTGERTTLSYSASPDTVCTAAAATGVLTLVGAGDCVVTVTAAGSDDYNEASDTFTVTVQAIDQLALNVNAIATDDTINIAEKASGFAISGDTGSVGEVSVTVTVGETNLTATSSTANPATWSVTVPADAAYITGTSVAVAVNASKTGYSPPGSEQRALTVDLVAPAPPGYTAPGSLTVGVPIAAMNPSGGAGIDEYAAPGLPPGLDIDTASGAISGTPDTAGAGAAEVTVTVSDSAGNPATVDIAFPAVDKGDQTLSGFQYGAASVRYGSTAPAVTPPTGSRGALSYSATPATVCTAAAATGALVLVGAGDCVITVTAAGTDDYNEASDTFTVAVQAAGTLALKVDAIATDNTINIAEKASGFAITGDTGTEGGVTVTVGIGAIALTATSADDAGAAAWSVSVPADAAYITGTSVAVSVSAAKTAFSAPDDVARTLTVDLVAPEAPTYTAPELLQVGVPIDAMNPSGGSGIDAYSAERLPSGLSIDPGTGAIGGTPDTAEAGADTAEVTVSDTAGNTATVDIAFPAVAKRDQALVGFRYSTASVTFGSTAPTVTAPAGVRTTLSYSATPTVVCAINASTGALTLLGAGQCLVTATAAGSATYNVATATYTVTVVDSATPSAGVILTVSLESLAESADATTVTVTGTLDQSPRTTDTAVTVSVGAFGDEAVEGADYATVNDLTLTISAGQTSGTATFSLMPDDDDVDEADESLAVAGSTSVSGLTVTGTTITITDDDKRGVDVSPTSLIVSEGGRATYSVVLTSEPTAPVTVTPSVTGSSDVTPGSSWLTFTASTWNIARTMRVLAAQDTDEVNDTATIEHAVSGADYGDNSVMADDVAVTVGDDETDSTGITLTLSPERVDEDAGATSVTVTGTLNHAPLSTDTTVTVSVGATGDAAVEGADYATVNDLTMTIDAGDTTGTASFTLTLMADDLDEEDEALSVGGTAEGLEVTGARITINDDDLNYVPVFPEELPGMLEVAENTAADTAIGAPLAATDEHAHALSYALEGLDADRFAIDPDSGQLRTLAALDHETKAGYSVTVTADDGHGGTAGIAVRLTVTDVDEQPGTPEAPTVLASANSTTSLSLRWSAPDSNGGPAITGYAVQYREGTTGAWSNHRRTVTDTRATVTGLAAATDHQARVQARNGEAPGAWSEPGAGRTGDADNNAPAFDAALPGVLTAEENTAAGTDLGAPFTATDSDEDTLTYLLDGADRHAFVIDAETGQLRASAALDHESQASYSLTVRADDGHGGRDSLAMTINVADIDEQPGTPAAPVVLAARGSATRLEVNWNAPDTNGGPAIAGYEVQYRAIADTGTDTGTELDAATGEEGPWLTHRHRGAGTRTAIAYLEPSTAYQARVRALNREIPGEWSEPGAGSTGDPVNSPPVFDDGLPARVTVDENTATDIDIGAPFTATDADEDTLTYLLDGADRRAFAIDPESGQLRTSAALDHEAKPRYFLTVRADDGKGGADAIRVRVGVDDLDEQAPPLSAPGVLATVDSTTGLDLHWSAPRGNGGPPVTGYEVQYREGTDGEWIAHEHEGVETRTAIGELLAATDYQARVRALNGEIPGDWSEPGAGSTGRAVNNAPVFDAGLPATLTVDENTGADTDIGTPFAAGDADGDVLTWLLDGADRHAFALDADSGQLRTRAPLDHEAGASRSLSVQVSDGAGGADMIEVTVNVADLEEQPAQPSPPLVLATAGTTMSLDVRWRTPDAGGGPPVTGYEVQYREGTDGEWIDHGHEGAETRTAIGELAVSADYQARLRALNGEAPGEWSEPGAGSTGREDNNPPEFADERATRSVPEDSGRREPVGAPVTAVDMDRDSLTYTLDGDDAASFDIDPQTGQILTRAVLDYETKPSHAVTVTASDGQGGADTVEVAIELIDTQEQQAALGPEAPTGVTMSRSLSLDANNTVQTEIALRWNAPEPEDPEDASDELSDGTSDGTSDEPSDDPSEEGMEEAMEDTSWFEFRLGRYPESDNGLAPAPFQCAGNRPFEPDGWRRIPDSGPDGANARSYRFDAQALGCYVLPDTFELRAQVRAVTSGEEGMTPRASAPSTEARMRDEAPRVVGLWLDAVDVDTFEADDDLVFVMAFTEPVRVAAADGSPTLGIGFGEETRQAAFAAASKPPAFRNYGSGHIGSRLEFRYRVQEGDDLSGGIFVPADAIAVSGGATIVDATGPGGHAANLRNPLTTISEGSTVLASSPEEALTAGFEPDSVPEAHDGETAFSVQVGFGEPGSTDGPAGDDGTAQTDGAGQTDGPAQDDPPATQTPPDLDGLTLSASSFLVTGGRITDVSRLEAGDNQYWVVGIEPDSKADVSISLGPTFDCAGEGAVCTGDGRRLANNIHAVVKGPPGLGVADARVAEGPDATMDFAVTLGRALTEAVSVDFATAAGTATPGEDYIETSGTLTFKAGEISKTVAVEVLDDAHDDDGETFTLTLSNPSGGNAYLVQATATGTIQNSDPMPKAWIARFGRTVSDHVVEAIQARLRDADGPGRRISRWAGCVWTAFSPATTPRSGPRAATRRSPAGRPEPRHTQAAVLRAALSLGPRRTPARAQAAGCRA